MAVSRRDGVDGGLEGQPAPAAEVIPTRRKEGGERDRAASGSSSCVSSHL